MTVDHLQRRAERKARQRQQFWSRLEHAWLWCIDFGRVMAGIVLGSVLLLVVAGVFFSAFERETSTLYLLVGLLIGIPVGFVLRPKFAPIPSESSTSERQTP